eukprot:Pgem_evm1s18260
MNAGLYYTGLEAAITCSDNHGNDQVIYNHTYLDVGQSVLSVNYSLPVIPPETFGCAAV